MHHIIYLDHAATTPVRQEVLDAMIPYFRESFGNPSSFYQLGKNNHLVIEQARECVAQTIGAASNNIVFTSGGSEADNHALKMVAEQYQNKGRHIITSKIEHHAILETCKYLEKKGYDITYLDVDEKGMIKLSELQNSIRKDTILISIMFANNEIGTIQPIQAISTIAHAHHVLFHTDAVSAYGHYPIDVKEYQIDLMSVSGHKIYGPKGIGFLFVRDGIQLENFIHGGKQEKERRAGTENVPAIVGFAKAAELATTDLISRTFYERELSNRLIRKIYKRIPYVRLNGDRHQRLANNVNMSFQFVDGEALMVLLNLEGICVSVGSACNTGNAEASYVLKAIGMPDDVAKGTIRITLGYENTEQEIDETASKIEKIVYELRQMSPQYQMLTVKHNKKL